MEPKTRAVFGPVPSRRLGVSLGVDLLPYKTCSLDCVYCECGATTRLTCERREYYPTASVLKEIDTVLAESRKIDFLTFSGVGEPTLHSGIGRIIDHVKTHYPKVRVCLLTNGTLLGDLPLRRELRNLDLVVPSLDGSNEEEMRTVNRPCAGVTLNSLMDALSVFRADYPRIPMWLEVFLVPGVNDFPASLERFRSLFRTIRPDKVQLNSLDRPGAVDWIRVPSRERLEEIAAALAGDVPVEIVSRVKNAPTPAAYLESFEECADRILKTLRSRPCTADDLAMMLGVDTARLAPHLRRMEKAFRIVAVDGPRGRYFRPS